MKKKIGIILGVIVVIVLCFALWLYLMCRPMSGTGKVVFKIEAGTNKVEIVDNLKKAGLVRSKYATLVYVFLTPSLNLQAGEYEIDRNSSVSEILNIFNKGRIRDTRDIIRITFIEGKRFKDYAKQISDNFDISYDDIINKAKDEEYLKELINSYWFIDESILNDKLYFALEGYLFPNTYEFYAGSSIEVIFKKMLDSMEANLEPYKEIITSSSLSAHEYLTKASIAEKEAVNADDRAKVVQVINTRIDSKIPLGMDVTTYYGVMKDMSEDLFDTDLADNNPYNTRAKDFLGLPAGPICSPSAEAIKAAFNPADTAYVYFVADIETGKVYFAETIEEFIELKKTYVK